MDTDWVWVLVPVTALSIPLVAVVGRVIVRPIALAIAKIGEADRTAISAARSEQRFAELDGRLARIEQLLGVLAEHERRRQLQPTQEAPPLPRLEANTRTPVTPL
jgi:hypothetical protein